MIEIGNTYVSEELLEEKFVCDLNACKGACCVLGDTGAPVDEDELEILDDIYEDVKPFLRPEGVKALEAQGTFVIEEDGSFSTPLVEGRECAYTIFDDRGIALCGIEKAYRAGVVKWKKPISCELYPIRTVKLHDHEGLNYHRWPICKPACECGEQMKVPVYRFLRAAITRKYGAEYYQQLELADEFLKNRAKE
jgi:hypothetical protein